jgi:hypothetical protein
MPIWNRAESPGKIGRISSDQVEYIYHISLGSRVAPSASCEGRTETTKPWKNIDFQVIAHPNQIFGLDTGWNEQQPHSTNEAGMFGFLFRHTW